MKVKSVVSKQSNKKKIEEIILGKRSDYVLPHNIHSNQMIKTENSSRNYAHKFDSLDDIKTAKRSFLRKN